MLGQLIVLVASVLTAGLIASIVGPQIFHDHLLQSGDTANSPELSHIELAYREANTMVLGVALLTSLVCALVVTWLVSRPLRRSLNELTDGARELSRGHYSHRVRAVGGGSELDTFAAVFNTMAVRLDDVETTAPARMKPVGEQDPRLSPRRAPDSIGREDLRELLSARPHLAPSGLMLPT